MVDYSDNLRQARDNKDGDEEQLGFFEFVEMVLEIPSGTGADYIRSLPREEVEDWLNGECGYKAHIAAWSEFLSDQNV